MAHGVVVLADGVRNDDLSGSGLVEVHERVGAPTTYYLHYPVVNMGGDLTPLAEARLGPGAELAIFQRSAGLQECLVKGPVFSHQIRLVHGVDGSQLEVIGADATLAMDRETRITQWADGTSDADAVSAIVAGYGLAPDVQMTNTRHLETRRTLIQHGTDLSFVRLLARRNGCIFWVRCDANLVETAHFKPPPLDAANPVVLTINQDNPTLDSFEIAWDVERPTSVVAQAYDGAAKGILDGSGVALPPPFAGDVGLAAIVSEPRSTSLVAAVADVGDLIGRASGVLLDASWFLQATCTVSLRRLGRVVHAHEVVEVRGAGSRYSGRYFVTAVRHVIDASDQRMTLTLVRNGWRG